MAKMSSERPVWALPSGLPTAHLVRAALRAASLIDAHGSPIPAARSSYLLYPSDALYPPEDLRLGEQLLLDCELLAERDSYLNSTPELAELLAVTEDEAASIVLERAALAQKHSPPLQGDESRFLQATAVVSELVTDPERREALLLALARKYDRVFQAELGARGEDFVVERARQELAELGRDNLVDRVRRLSELSDELGYDVVAPRLHGNRRLEVKTTAHHDDGLIRFFVSRNEIDVGLRDEDWALVACRVRDGSEMELVGWCRAAALSPYLPIDSEGGQWREAELAIPLVLFEADLPPLA